MEEVGPSPAHGVFRRRFAAPMTEAKMLALGVGITENAPCKPRMPPRPDPCRTCYKLYGL